MARPPREASARPQNPVLDRLEQKSKQSAAYHASAGLEKGLAKRVGGYRTAGSGNKKEKGDVRVNGVTRIEHKGTKHNSFRVTKEMLEKLELAGRGCDEIPIFVVDFLSEQGKSSGQEIACIPLKDLLDLINEKTTTEGTDSGHAKHPKPKARKRPHRR